MFTFVIWCVGLFFIVGILGVLGETWEAVRSSAIRQQRRYWQEEKPFAVPLSFQEQRKATEKALQKICGAGWKLPAPCGAWISFNENGTKTVNL